MTPLYDLNQPSPSFPFLELQEDHHLQLFLSTPHDHHHASAANYSPPPNFFNTVHHDQIRSTKHIGESSCPNDHQVDKYKSQNKSSDHVTFSSSMEVHKLPSTKRKEEEEGEHNPVDGSVSDKWMPSKMRLMQKVINSSETNSKPKKFTIKFQDHHHTNDYNETNNSATTNNIRVCTDCNTTTTPLWRSGPRGPKSLCNACGIRQRKARRAMAAAATMENGTAVTVEISSTKGKIKEKKARTSHVTGQCKKLCKTVDHQSNNQSQKTKISFKNLALSLSKNSALQRVFPQDVEEAAILLMGLSCGFIH